MGLSNVDHMFDFVEFLRTKLPESSKAADCTDSAAVFDCQTMSEVDPFRSRRFPASEKVRVAVESAGEGAPSAAEATQMGILLS